MTWQQTYVKSGHFLSEDLAKFDAPFFNMTSVEVAVGSQSS